MEDGRPLLAVVAVCYYPAFVSLLRRSNQAKPARYEDGRMKADERRQRTESWKEDIEHREPMEKRDDRPSSKRSDRPSS